MVTAADAARVIFVMRWYRLNPPPDAASGGTLARPVTTTMIAPRTSAQPRGFAPILIRQMGRSAMIVQGAAITDLAARGVSRAVPVTCRALLRPIHPRIIAALVDGPVRPARRTVIVPAPIASVSFRIAARDLVRSEIVPAPSHVMTAYGVRSMTPARGAAPAAESPETAAVKLTSATPGFAMRASINV